MGTAPRREKWKGISERLGLSEQLIFMGHPQTPADYEFIANHRNEIEEAERILKDRPSPRPEERPEPGPTARVLPRPDGRIIPVTEQLRAIRVVSWAHAGEAGTYEQIPEHEQEQIVTASSDPKAFAVTVEGESMTPDYKPGDRVVVAPSRVPRNGRPVVVKLADDGILLRLFHRVNPRTIRLTSLNPDIYPPTDLREGEYRWCWPVEEQIRRHF